MIKKTLSKFESSNEPFSEIEVDSALRKAIKEEEFKTDKGRKIMLAERFAFSFAAGYSHEGTGWGTYYGPLFSGINKEGGDFEWPSLSEIDCCMILYWKKRAEETKHPLFKTRYADLVWEFSKTVTGTPAEVKFAWWVIDSTLKAIHGGKFKYEKEAIDQLERALDLALSINDKERINKVRDTIIDFEDKVSEDSKLGLWGFSFDLLVEKKKEFLNEEQELKIVKDLEGRLERLSKKKPENIDPHLIEAAALRLAKYYRSRNDNKFLEIVLNHYRDAFVEAAKNADPFVAHSWLKTVYGVLYQFGFNKKAEGLENLIRDYGKKAQKEMKTISTEVSITKKEKEQFISEMLKGSFEESLTRIAVYFIPDPEETKEEVLELAKKAPLFSNIKHSLVDNEGRILGEIGPVEEDLEGHIVRQISQNMSLSSPFLDWLLNELHDRGDLTVGSLTELLKGSPVFKEERVEILERGLKAFFEEDYCVSVHLLIPQIEEAFRNLLSLSGGKIYRPGRRGGINLRLLDSILRDPIMEEVIREKGCTYFRILLTDLRGWNLRNYVMHGFFGAEVFSKQIAQRVIHSLLFLSLIRESK